MVMGALGIPMRRNRRFRQLFRPKSCQSAGLQASDPPRNGGLQARRLIRLHAEWLASGRWLAALGHSISTIDAVSPLLPKRPTKKSVDKLTPSSVRFAGAANDR